MVRWIVRFLPLCILVLALFLVSCSGEQELEYPEYSGVFQNEKLGVQISDQMTKEDVDALLTPAENEETEKPEEVCKAWPVIYGEGEDRIQVMYDWKTDEVYQISVWGDDGSIPSNWAVDGRISLGSTKKEIEQTYGTPSTTGKDSVSYNYNSDGKKTDGTNTAVILSFFFDSEGRTEDILLVP